MCYVLSYRAPDYIRTLSLLKALEADSAIKLVRAMNTSTGLRRYVETWQALQHAVAKDHPAAYILGFRGHEIFWLVHKLIKGKPVIFDALMSPYAALHEERKGGAVGAFLAPLVYRLEHYALHHSTVILTDTQLHADFYVKTFGLKKEKVVVLPVGAVESAKAPAPTIAPSNQFSVLFYGSFLALHGIDIIVAAAAELKDCQIRFDFIGGRPRQIENLHSLCANAGVTQYTHRQWVVFQQLVDQVIPQASLCLGGPFGGTQQARRVVTGKTSQCLALGKPTVVGAIAEDYGFVDRSNCLLVDQSDPAALASAIRWAYENQQKLDTIGVRGRVLYGQRLSVKVIGKRLSKVLASLGLRS